jgi:hypothetical protein
MPAAPAPLATAEVDVVIGVVQVDGVVAVDIIRRYHRRNIKSKVPGIAWETP